MPLLLLSMLLGGGMSSRLFQRVREELGLAYSVYTFQSFHADVGMHGVYVGTASGDRARRRSTRFDAELAAVVDDGLPAEEIAMGKQQLKGQITLSLESVSCADVSRARRSSSTASRTARSMRCSRWSMRSPSERGRRASRASSSRPSGRRW